MPIPQTCACRTIYTFKDEYSGQMVKCPTCKTVLTVGASGAPVAGADHIRSTAAGTAMESAFAHDKFLFRQKHFAIREKYDVQDEQGRPLLYIERASHIFRNLMAIFAAIMAGGVAFTALFMLINTLFKDPSGWLILVIFMFSVGAFFAVLVRLYRARHLAFYPDASKSRVLMRVLQGNKFELLEAVFRIEDASGRLIATVHKNYLLSIFRKRWECRNPDGSRICVAKEDSIILALLRRLLGNFFGLLVLNFVIFDADEAAVLGEFNRKFTLLDRYVLDMTFDRDRKIDRRLAVALGVMLDTGERR